MLPRGHPIKLQGPIIRKHTFRNVFHCRECFKKMTTGGLEDGEKAAVAGTPGIKDARKKGLPWLIAAFVAVIFVLLLLLLLFVVREYASEVATHPDNTTTLGAVLKKTFKDLKRLDWPQLSARSLQAQFKKTAVVSDNALCSEIGRNVLLRGGNAVDAAIATGICVGGLNSHSSGIGGGFLMTLYTHRGRRCSTIDAREAAPLGTQEDTFKDSPKDAFVGYKSIAVPGEVHGYWTAFKRYGSGRVAWQDLIMPTVNHLKAGYPCSRLMEGNIESIKEDILNEPSLRSAFLNPQTNQFYREGELIKNEALAETLRRLAVSSDPVQLFYHGEMAQQIGAEIFSHGGLLTPHDLKRYSSVVDERPVEYGGLDSLSMCGPKPPSSFPVLAFIVAVMSKLYPPGTEYETILNDDAFYHHFIEAQKFGFAQRTQLGDVRFTPESRAVLDRLASEAFVQETADKIRATEGPRNKTDYGLQQEQPGKAGTSHTSVVDAEGNAVSLTASINNRFGSRRRSTSLGIIWNDEMDDFSIPGNSNFFGFEPSKANYIFPGKRPMSSMCPVILYDTASGHVRASLGAAGGSRIVSALAQFIVLNVNVNTTVKEAIDFPRIHNQFTPFGSMYEAGFPQPMVDALLARGHEMQPYNFPFPTVQAIVRNADGSLEASNDHRRPIYMNPAGY